MTDLNDFFAKKDRKKKRAAAAAKSAQQAAPQLSAPSLPAEKIVDDSSLQQTNTIAQGPSPHAPPSKPDDGWIEIEDLRGSQVNTGGRTVVEFRRDLEEKEANGENTIQSEKFSGWNKGQSAEPEEAEKEVTPTAPFKQPESAFPTLADAAKVRQVPSQKPTAPVQPAERQRPRFILDKEKLRRKLQENASQGS